MTFVPIQNACSSSKAFDAANNGLYSQPGATSCRDAEQELPGAVSPAPGYFGCHGCAQLACDQD